MDKELTNLYILSWDQNGLEACINITKMEQEQMWARLQDKPHRSEINQIVQHLMLRARANSQRHYEIYTIQVDTSISEEDIREMFESTPQSAAELIRGRGNCVFSDRVNKQQVRIT